MWSRRSIEILAGVTLLAAVAACSVTPRRAPPVQAGTGSAIQAAQPGAGPGAAAAASPPPVAPEAKAEFDQALALAGGGNDAAAEAQLTSLAGQYPQFSTPLVNLGILYRKDGNLDAATHALEQAVARDPRSAPAWTELGVTQRLGGKFKDAEQSYARAIAADPAYAPPYRDRGVLRDLYLDEPAAALGDFAQYRKLAAQDKRVVMWIAELQHRTGIRVPADSGPASPAAPAPATAASAPSPAPAATALAPHPQARN